jgi:hypothetical protein
VFPLTPVIDNCTRADENPLTNGGLWSAKFISTDFNLKILTNQMVGAGASDSSNVTAADYGPDCELWTVGTGGTDFGTNILLRINSPGVAGVTGYLVFFSVSGDQVTIQRIDNSTTFVTILPAQNVGAYVFSDTLGASIVGGTITAYINGVPKASVGDATYKAPGKLGIRKFSTQMPLINVGGGTILPGNEPKKGLPLVYMRRNA